MWAVNDWAARASSGGARATKSTSSPAMKATSWSQLNRWGIRRRSRAHPRA